MIFKPFFPTPLPDFVRLTMSLAVALVYGITFINQGRLDPDGVDISKIQNVMGESPWVRRRVRGGLVSG